MTWQVAPAGRQALCRDRCPYRRRLNGGAVPSSIILTRFLFIGLLLFCCLTSAWKVDLQILPTSGSTLSVSYAAALMALVLLGPAHAMVIAVAGAWTQCTLKAK